MLTFRPMILTAADPKMREAMLVAARAYAKATKLPMRRVSRLVYKDSRYFDALRRGKIGVVASKYDQVMLFFATESNWPGGLIPAGAVVDIFART